MMSEKGESPKKSFAPDLGLHWSALYGVVGVLALLGQAIVRIAPRAVDTLQGTLTTTQWVLLVGFTFIMLYSEGYKGFQKAFSPRVASRAFFAQTRGIWAKLLAPFFCMGLFDATKKRKIVSWVLVTMIIALVVSVQALPDPWRGIIDVGVVAGLGYGWMATLIAFFRAARSGPQRDPELGD